jgi:hypothetical protein
MADGSKRCRLLHPTQISGQAPRSNIVRWLDQLCTWLDQTSLSQTIQNTAWVVPTVQTIHILSIAVVVASALMVDLRLLGAVGADQSLKRVSARFLPLIWWPLLVLLVTGVIMIIGEPAHSLKNPMFQLKMGLLVAAMMITGIHQLMLGRDLAYADSETGPSRPALLIAILSMLAWGGIVFAGRSAASLGAWIAVVAFGRWIEFTLH